MIYCKGLPLQWYENRFPEAIKVVVIGKAFLNENHQCCSKNERPWYTVLIWNIVPCPSKDGWGSAAIRNGPHTSETQRSKSLILALTTSPEEVGRELCSFQSLRDPGWWRIHLISIGVHDHIFRGKHFKSLHWGDTSVHLFLAKTSCLCMSSWKKKRGMFERKSRYTTPI